MTCSGADSDRNYRWEYGFGELGGSGSSRRDLLSRLIPKLAIAALCSLEERFLLAADDEITEPTILRRIRSGG